MASVLVVEDDQFVRSALIRHLGEAAHTVRSVGTALEALREVAQVGFDVVILDLGLPDLDGSEALKMLRGLSDVPVIVATARDDEAEIVRLLNAGADDYLVKPFSVEHLSARLAAVLRRARGRTAGPAAEALIRVGGLQIDVRRRQAALDGVGARPDPARVRPARLPRRPPRRGRAPPRTARRGLAAVLRRRPDDRRPPVVAAPQARRDRGPAALSAHAARGRA